MNRAVAVMVALVVLAGSVPAAAALTDTQTESAATAPGASFAGVVGVQQAEVGNEVAGRALNQQLAAAESNDSKASVVADQHRKLSERLDALEAEKERITQAYENGNMSRGEYQARLAALGAELQALENRANRTAEVASTLPEAALQSNGANVSEIRALAHQANRTSGGEVAEAARSIAGAGVGEGLRGPPNASERGPSENVGEQLAGAEGNESERSSGPDNGNAAGEDRRQDVTTDPAENESDRGNGDGAPDTTGSGDAADGNETAGQENTSDTSGNESSTGDTATTDRSGEAGAEGESNSDDTSDGTDGTTETDGTETESA